jgi:iron complex transport system permease protein
MQQPAFGAGEGKWVLAIQQKVENPAVRYRIGMLLLTVVFIVIFFSSFCLGRYPISPGQVFQYLPYAFMSIGLHIANIIGSLFNSIFSPDTPFIAQSLPLPEGADTAVAAAFIEVRFPRVLAAALIGAALSVAGASYQGVFQNPMVSQDILGASQGAAFGASLGFLLVLGAFWITSLSFIFGIIAVLLTFLIGRASRVSTILGLILAGMVVSGLFVSGTSFIKLVADTQEILPAITYWLMGSLTSIRSADIGFILLLVPAAIPIILLRWRINLLATGEEEARSLGLNVQAMRVIVLGCATLLAAICVSVSGMIGWVGLVIPHFCRLMFGYDYRRIIWAAILIGASFLILVDDVARLATTSEIPIGILTGVIGAPVFIYLLLRRGERSAH